MKLLLVFIASISLVSFASAENAEGRYCYLVAYFAS